MKPHDVDRSFAGSIPAFYEKFLVPLIFEPYAPDMAERVRACRPANVLEIAAGTGVVTRALAQALGEDVAIVATDLNPPMIDHAAKIGTARPVEWRQADAMQLPFDDASFDVVVCQFGVMFFPDKPRALAEARRVLRPGGVLLVSAWDRIEKNDFADRVTSALATRYPGDPPRFLARTPHGYHDRDQIARDVKAGGFSRAAMIDTIARRSVAAACDLPAIAYCQGTPLRNEIEARDPNGLAQATELGAKAVELAFGAGPVDGAIQAHVVTVVK